MYTFIVILEASTRKEALKKFCLEHGMKGEYEKHYYQNADAEPVQLDKPYLF